MRREQVGRTGAVAKLTPRAGAHAALLALLLARADVAREEQGTELFIVHTDPISPDAIWVYEVYAGEEAEQAHMAAPGYAQARAMLDDLLGAPPEVYPLIPLAGKGLPRADTPPEL